MTQSEKPTIALIGTGMAALACADALGQGFAVSLFDKSRGLSGRLSTRRATAHAFDHGTQYFRADEARFADWLKPFETGGHVREWTPRHVTIAADGTMAERPDAQRKLVFAPAMSAIGKALVAGRPQWQLYLDTGIERIEGAPGAWMLVSGDHRFGPFAHVILAIPPLQAAALLPDGAGFAADLARVKMQGCHTLMLGYADDEAPAPAWDCAHFGDDILGFAGVNSAKPARGGGFALTLQTRHDWSEAHIEDDGDAVAAQMKTRLAKLTGLPVSASAYERVHRWRFASTVTPVGQAFLRDADLGLAAIGDWCMGSKVQDAFLSGTALASALRV